MGQRFKSSPQHATIENEIETDNDDMTKYSEDIHELKQECFMFNAILMHSKTAFSV